METGSKTNSSLLRVNLNVTHRTIFNCVSGHNYVHTFHDSLEGLVQ
uniref:Uncharacterized protein n=1 Tax=Ciona intestinalis TaxID=7719 RepID=H2XSN6_CIOIN